VYNTSACKPPRFGWCGAVFTGANMHASIRRKAAMQLAQLTIYA
jgi:hypothetical protein